MMTRIIPRVATPVVGIALLLSPFGLRPLLAQDHSQMHHGQSAKPPKKVKVKKKPNTVRAVPISNMPAMDHGKMPATGHGGHGMKGFLGPYGIGRDGSGTSWQPDNSPHQGIHAQ